MLHGTRLRWAALLAALLLGAGLRVEALSSGFFGDDYPQLAMLRGEFPIARPGWDLFWFGPRDLAERARLLDAGFLPWWSAPGHRIAMFRPLASVLLWLDQRAFGSDALGYHLHALGWWLLLIAAAWQLLFRLLPPRSAALALVLFALAGAQHAPLGWIANRSTLLATGFGVLALSAQVIALERNALRWLLLSALGWSLALSAGEYAFGVLAYAPAHAWLAHGAHGAHAEHRAHGEHRRVRWTAVLAAAVPACVYLALRAALGHGVVASGLYVSPGDARFWSAAPGRWLALAGELVLGLPAKHFWSGAPLREQAWRLQLFTPAQWQRLPDWTTVHALLGVLALALGLLALRWLARRGAPEHATVRWLLAGSALGVLAGGAALPESRLLLAPALGSSAALAVLAVHAAGGLRTRVQPWLAATLAAIALVHGVAAGQRAWSDARALRARNAAARSFALRAPIPWQGANRDVVLIAAGDFSTASALPWLRRLYGAQLPRSYRRLSGHGGPHRLRRVDARTLDLVLIGAAPGAFAGSLYRPLDRPLAPAQSVALPRMTVSVRALRDGDPVELRVRSDRPLEDVAWLWLHPYPSGLRRIALPAPGHELVLPPPAAAWQ